MTGYRRRRTFLRPSLKLHNLYHYTLELMFSPPIRLVPPTWCLRLRDPIIPLILERPVGWQHVVLSTTATLELLKNHPILASALLTLKEVSSGSLEEQSQVVGSLASQHKSLRTFLAPEPFLHSAQGALLSAGLAISRHSCSASGGKRGARWNSTISLRGDGGDLMSIDFLLLSLYSPKPHFEPSQSIHTRPSPPLAPNPPSHGHYHLDLAILSGYVYFVSQVTSLRRTHTLKRGHACKSAWQVPPAMVREIMSQSVRGV